MMKKFKRIITILLFMLFTPLIAKAEEVDFKPINYYGDVKLDSHYIIAAHNTSNDKWYALGSSETGEAISVEISDPTNGLKIDKKKIKTENYIFVCSKREDYNSFKLRSNILDEPTGKKYSLYLSSETILNLGGGTLYFTYSINNPNNYFKIGRSNTGLKFDNSTNQFYVNNGYYYRSGDDLMILSDDEPLINNPTPKEFKKVKSLKRMHAATRNKKFEAFQLVYKANDGNNYILTSKGTKKVNITDEKFTTDDYLYFDNDYTIGLTSYHTYGTGTSNIHMVSNDKYININNNGIFSDYYDSTYQYIDLIFQKYHYQNNNVYPIEYFTTPSYFQEFTENSEEANLIYDEIEKNETMRYKINQGNYFIGWDETNKEFIPVWDQDDGVLFDYYTIKTLNELTKYQYHNLDNNIVHSWETYENNIDYYYNTEEDEDFLGWTDDPTKAGYIEKSEWENLYVYNENTGTMRINDQIIDKYSIKYKFSDCRKENDIVNLYPVLTKKYDIVVQPFIASEEKPIIGVSDWKNNQEGKTEEYLIEHEKNQGSINVEIYRDGKIWKQDKLYFRYDNDNAADLNIKFIPNNYDSSSNYLTDPDTFESSPDNYYIVGVHAEQGDSEEGLYERFNWMSETGGQLDNVKGGSTVKIYLSTKYTSKYYLNDVLYKTDSLKYTPTATKKAIQNNSNNSDYKVNSDSNNTLLNKTDDISFFKEDNLGRGEYSTFSYEITKERDTMEVLDLPNQTLKYNFWIVKDSRGNIIGKAIENETIQIVFKDDVDFLYIGNEDSIDTIHLYAYTPKYANTPNVPKNIPTISTNKNNNSNNPKPINNETTTKINNTIENPKTGDNIIIYIILLLISFAARFYLDKKIRD